MIQGSGDKDRTRSHCNRTGMTDRQSFGKGTLLLLLRTQGQSPGRSLSWGGDHGVGVTKVGFEARGVVLELLCCTKSLLSTAYLCYSLSSSPRLRLTSSHWQRLECEIRSNFLCHRTRPPRGRLAGYK